MTTTDTTPRDPRPHPDYLSHSLRGRLGRSFFARTLTAIAKEHGVRLTTLSDEWVRMVHTSEGDHAVVGFDIGLNTSTAARIARDKTAAALVLAQSSVPAVLHELVRDPTAPGAHEHNGPARAHALLSSWGGTAVCKPNEGSGGRNVTRVTTPAELDEALDVIFATHESATLSPMLSVDAEFRVIVLDEHALLAYEKVRSDTAEFRHNLACGAIPHDIPDDEYASIQRVAQRAVRAIGIRFAAVDIVRTGGTYQVLEVNSNVVFEHYVRHGRQECSRAYAVYERAFEALLTAHQ